jgi:tRNA(Ile2) C34 agmatinyltransferase TiaS
MMIFPKTLFPWFFIPVLIFWLVALGSAMSTPRLVCPGCCNEMERSFGRYCPECGNSHLQPGGWFRAPHCRACGKSMRRGKGRHYKIRACTHCGLMLDDGGL